MRKSLWNKFVKILSYRLLSFRRSDISRWSEGILASLIGTSRHLQTPANQRHHHHQQQQQQRQQRQRQRQLQQQQHHHINTSNQNSFGLNVNILLLEFGGSQEVHNRFASDMKVLSSCHNWQSIYYWDILLLLVC